LVEGVDGDQWVAARHALTSSRISCEVNNHWGRADPDVELPQHRWVGPGRESSCVVALVAFHFVKRLTTGQGRVFASSGLVTPWSLATKCVSFAGPLMWMCMAAVFVQGERVVGPDAHVLYSEAPPAWGGKQPAAAGTCTTAASAGGEPIASEARAPAAAGDRNRTATGWRLRHQPRPSPSALC
jgi:hypothetical protein